MRGRVKQFFEGVRLVGAGFRVWKSSPRLMAIGLIPGLITAVLFTALLISLVLWADDWADALVGGVTHDATPNRLLVVIVAVAMLGAGVLIGIFAFTAVTLLIGQPFFEKIAAAVAVQSGMPPTVDEQPFWRSTWRGIGEGLRLLFLGLTWGIAMFFVGLVPFVGTVAAFIGNAFFGGHMLGLELTAYPLSRVGVITLRQRRQLVRQRRALALGFGVTAFLLCLIPLGALVSMPALVAGGTLLAIRLVGGDAAGVVSVADSQERVMGVDGQGSQLSAP